MSRNKEDAHSTSEDVLDGANYRSVLVESLLKTGFNVSLKQDNDHEHTATTMVVLQSTYSGGLNTNVCPTFQVFIWGKKPNLIVSLCFLCLHLPHILQKTQTNL